MQLLPMCMVNKLKAVSGMCTIPNSAKVCAPSFSEGKACCTQHVAKQHVSKKHTITSGAWSWLSSRLTEATVSTTTHGLFEKLWPFSSSRKSAPPHQGRGLPEHWSERIASHSQKPLDFPVETLGACATETNVFRHIGIRCLHRFCAAAITNMYVSRKSANSEMHLI